MRAKCMILDLNHGVVPIEVPESRYIFSREWICERCGKSFSESHPTRIGDTCRFDPAAPRNSEGSA